MSQDIINGRKNVPASALDEVVDGYKADGASVVVTPQGGGLYTVVATFPDVGAQAPAGGPPPPAGGPPAAGAAAVAPAEPPDDPAPLAAFAGSVGTTFWPVVDPGPNTRLVSYHPSAGQTIGNIGRCFFDDRPGRHHVGVDLFAEEGDPVVACADGKIVSFYKFYNSKGRDTFALVIAHDGVVINYGEIAPNSLQEFSLKIGDSVKAGQTVGRIGATGMLHFETYEPGTKQNIPWMDNQPRPLQLRNPTQLLFNLATIGKSAGPEVQAPPKPAAPQVVGRVTPSPVLQKLDPALRAALRMHEIGTASPYRLFFAGKGKSGASFGFMQGDLAAGQSEVTQTFHDSLAAASFREDQISSFIQQLSVHLIRNPLSSSDTNSINAALLASKNLIDAMDGQILSGVYQQLQRCIATATAAGRSIAGKALIYMALWINMSGPPTKLLDWLSGRDPGLTHPIPDAGSLVDGAAMESYLQATSYYSENPENFPHMLQSAAAGEALLPTT